MISSHSSTNSSQSWDLEKQIPFVPSSVHSHAPSTAAVQSPRFPSFPHAHVHFHPTFLPNLFPDVSSAPPFRKPNLKNSGWLHISCSLLGFPLTDRFRLATFVDSWKTESVLPTSRLWLRCVSEAAARWLLIFPRFLFFAPLTGFFMRKYSFFQVVENFVSPFFIRLFYFRNFPLLTDILPVPFYCFSSAVFVYLVSMAIGFSNMQIYSFIDVRFFTTVLVDAICSGISGTSVFTKMWAINNRQ